MGSYPIDYKWRSDADEQVTLDDGLQEPNIYNKYLPFYESIKQYGSKSFNEILENLSRTIQLGEFHPGFTTWSDALEQFISIHGFYFTKIDHIKLINFYISILSIDDLNYLYVKTCFDMLFKLMWKTRLITRNDLIIDWRILYKWTKAILDNHDESHALVTLPKGIKISLYWCVVYCSSYFSTTATEEILDQIRPKLSPLDNSAFNDALHILELFLPVTMPPHLHSQGFKLWLPELLGIWESIYNTTLFNNPIWEWRMVSLFSRLAWYNIGYIEWEAWLPQIFTRILRNFSLPIGKTETYRYKCSLPMIFISQWIVAMIGNGSSCLQYLRDLFTAMKTFYHPSNTGKFQNDLVNFILELCEKFVDRVHLERKTHPQWTFIPHESYRLTEQDITDFVNCVKEYAFISIFNKNYMKEAATICQYISMLRPELIVPPIVEKLFASIDNLTEPHRFTSIMHCLAGIAREIVRQSQGQIYVLLLLMSVLPGIDSNDFEKTSVTLEFLNAILALVTCVDCSSTVYIRNDLTEIEKQVCLSTAQFEDFINEFLNRIFQMIDIISAEISDDVVTSTPDHIEDDTIELKLTSIMSSIVQQCSNKIFQMIREKITDYLTNSFFSSKARPLVTSLIRAILKNNPAETLKYILPQTCEKIMNNSEISVLNDHKGDLALVWYLTLFSELVRARGDALIIYKQMIMSVFHRCIHIIHKDSYKILGSAAKHLLDSLSNIYPIDCRRTIENIDEVFIDVLPIRVWGQNVDFDKLQVKFHIPRIDEIDFACEFIETFIYSELAVLYENSVKISNDERLRSLTLVYYIATGCLVMISPSESKEMHNLIPSVVSYSSKYQFQCPMYAKEPKFRENLRMRLFIDMEKLLDTLVENHPDDVSSLKTALKIYSLSCTYHRTFQEHYSKLCKDIRSVDKFFGNRLYGKEQTPRFLTIKRIALQIERFKMNNFNMFTEIDKQIVLKLFELSINRYSEVRRSAQVELFCIFYHYPGSFPVIVDRLIEVLNKSDEVAHDQIKGCLYVLHGSDHVFLPTKNSWTMIEKLWPSIVRLHHVNKTSTLNLINNLHNAIARRFHTNALIENTNEKSMCAAITLWCPLKTNEIETHDQVREERKRMNIQSYNNLMETLNSLLKGGTLTWGHQRITISLMSLLLQKHVPISSSCIQTFVDFLVHDDMEIRKCAVKGVAAFCRLQKSPRIYLQKPVEEVFQENDIPAPPVLVNDQCHRGDREDNLWVTINDYKPPEIQAEWEKTCFLDKSFHGYYKWPKLIKYSMNKRARYTVDDMPEQVAIIYDRFMDEKFLMQFIHFMVLDEHKGQISFDRIRFKMFKGLFRNFGFAFVENFMQQLYMLIREKTKEKYQGSQRVAAEIVAGMIRGSKYWTIEMLDDLWKKLTTFLNEMILDLNPESRYYWSLCFEYSMENQDPRRMHRLIDFFRTLINNEIIADKLNGESQWYVIQSLRHFQWRIPSIWFAINEHAKELLNHSSKGVRQRIANVLAISLSFDMKLPNGKSTRHPDANQFIESMNEQVHQAIEVYDKAPLANDSDIDSDARKAFNFIEAVILMHTNLFTWCQQPVNNAIIRLFPYLCEMESIGTNDASFGNNLSISRMYLATTYLHAHFLEALIQELEQVCTSTKWHARRAAVEFIQNMIFCNLFNARSYANRLHKLVLKCLFDEQFEVRTVASTTLSGFYQCGYVQVTHEDLKFFRTMSETSYFMTSDGKQVTSTENIIKRHAGVLGLCAIVLSSPYDIPTHMPITLMILCQHSYDPDMIQKSVKQCLSEFRRTHHDSWHEHREKFTENQLMILADALISHSYYV